MIMIAGVDSYVSLETTIGAGFGMCILIIIFFLYMNRKWCFNNSNNLSYCDEKLLSTKSLYSLRKKRYSHHDNSSTDSEDEILRRLKLQQLTSLKSDPYISSKCGEYGGLRSDSIKKNSINLEGFQPILSLNMPSTSKIIKNNTFLKNENLFNNNNSDNVRNSFKNIDLLGQAERGKIGLHAHSSSECSSNSSVEASVESNVGLISHDKKDHRHINPILSVGENDERNFGGKAIRLYAAHQEILEEVPNTSNNNEECIVDVTQDSLFDISDMKSLKSDFEFNLQDPTTSLVERGGSFIEIALLYDAPLRKMTVHVLQCRGIPTREKTTTHSQVRLLMLPSKKQKHKTKIRCGENPQFMESFLLHRINPEEVNSMALRVRVYGCERMRRERLIGETIINFASIDLELESNLLLPLEPRNNSNLSGSTSDLLSLARSDSTGSTISMQQHGGGVPELLLGLGYNGTTGRLTVEVVKGSHFRSLALGKAPDTYVKLCMVSSMGQEIAKAKTSTKRGQPNPLFKETFVFQVALFQLNDVTLMISVYSKKNVKRNEMVGWFSLGLNSSGPEEAQHFNDMRDAANINGQVGKCDLISRWHVLMQGDVLRRSSISNLMKLFSNDNVGKFTKENDICSVDLCNQPFDSLNFV